MVNNRILKKGLVLLSLAALLLILCLSGCKKEEDVPVETSPAITQTEATVAEPEPTVEEPEPTAEEPEPTVEKPEPTVEEPEPTAEEPAPTVEKPEPTRETPSPTIPANIDPEMLAILTESLAASTSADSYKCKSTSEIYMNVTGGSDPGIASISMSYNGTYARNNEMHLSMSFCMTVPDEPETMRFHLEIFLHEDYIYMLVKTPFPLAEEEWIKMKATPELVEQFTGSFSVIHETLSVLEYPQEIEHLRYEMYAGENCRVVRIVPEMNIMLDWALDQQSPHVMISQDSNKGHSTILVSEDVDELERMKELFKELSYNIWISTETKFLKKMDCYLLLDLTPEDMEMSEDYFKTMIMELDMETLIYDYNKPFTITLPEAAKNAEEITPMTPELPEPADT